MVARESETSAPWLGPRLEEEGLQRYARTVRERWRVIVACVIIALIGAGIYVVVAPKVYQATSELLVTPVEPSNPTTIGLGLISTSNNPDQDIATAASLVTTVPVATKVVSTLGLHETPRQLLAKVSSVPLANTSIVSVTASAPTAAGAQAIANAFVEQTVALRTQRVHAIEEKTIALLKIQAEHESKERLNAGGNESVASRLAGLEELLAQPDPTLSIAAPADRPTAPSSPRKGLSLVAGLFAGLILGLAAAFVLQNVDPRLRREEQLREVFRLPILSRVPRESTSKHAGPLLPDTLSPATVEAYRTLRATVFDAEHASDVGQSVMVTGSSPSEGKSSTALNLAYSLSQTERQVILIEADLHRPSLARALHVDPPFGLLGVLSGQVTLKDALVRVPDYPDNLSLLLVERPEPTAGDRLGLPIAKDMLRAAQSLADYVVVDSPPLNQIIDALPLAHAVDRVLVVVRLGTSQMNTLTEFGELLVHNGVRPLGVVLVDVERAARNSYYYNGASARSRLTESGSTRA